MTEEAVSRRMKSIIENQTYKIKWKEWLGCFYGISTIVGYLMPNLVNSYILTIYDL